MKTSNVKEQLKNVIDNLDESKLLEVLKGLTSKINLPFDYKSIKTFEDACERLGIDSDDVYNINVDTKDEIAYKKLKVIYKAINNEWVPDFTDSNQKKWYPYFRVLSSGVASSVAVYCYDFADTYVGVRLCTYSENVAIYIGRTFTTEYEDFLL